MTRTPTLENRFARRELMMSCLPCPASTNPQLVGDPVDTLTGAVFDGKLDFRLIGPLELWWFRHYDSSQSHQSFAFGWGQTHDYDRHLRFDADGIIYHGPIGRAYGFPPLLKDGQWCAANGFTLRRLSAMHYELHRHGEPRMEFEFTDPGQRARLSRLHQHGHQILFEYSADQRLRRIVDSIGRNILVSEEEDGRIATLTIAEEIEKPSQLLIRYEYDECGNLAATHNSSGYGYRFEYDQQNRLTHRIGRMGSTFRFEYDAQGRCIRSTGDDRLYEVALEYQLPGRVTKVTRADGGVWSYFFDEGGRLEQILDPLGGVRKYVRDESGRVTQEVDANENATNLIYDITGTPIRKMTPLGHAIQLPEDPNVPVAGLHRVAANAAEYEFGRLLNLGGVVLPKRSDIEDLRLSPKAQALVSIQPAEGELSNRQGADPRPLGVKWWPKPEQGREFNDFGKLVGQQDSWGRKRAWHYDASGNVASFNDFDGRSWSYDYGRWHFLLGETNPLGATIKYSYTPQGELASFIDAAGTESHFTYDLNDNLVEIRRHGVIRDTYVRDAVGNLIAKNASDGRPLLKFEIGTGNLPTKRILTSGDEHDFQYDGLGRYTGAATLRDVLEFTYDELGNCCEELRNGVGVKHQFHGWRRPIESKYFDKYVVRYQRLPNDTLVIADPTGETHQIRVHANGIIEREFSNGSRETSQYDQNGRCLIKHVDRSGKTWNRQYDWSGEGELRQVVDEFRGTTRHEYDAAHRLARRILPDGTTEVYEMDIADNLLRQPGMDARLGDGNRLESVNGFDVQYNDRDHIATLDTQNGAVTYVYDSRDQLTKIETPDGVFEAEYDALGRRTRKIWKGQTTEYYWNGDQLIGEIGPDGRVRLYIYADPLALTPFMFLDYDSLDADPADCQRYFIFTDQLGTPCLIEDEFGADVMRCEVSPFGLATIESDNCVTCNLRFPGHYFDAEVDLHYNRFRYYSPGLGRYIQSDPWGIAGGSNLYSYQTNPLRVSDVRGLGEEGDPRGCRPNDDEEGTTAPRYAPEILDHLYGPATDPWMIRHQNGEGQYPADAQVVVPGQPLRLNREGKYLYIIDQNGVVHVAPEYGTSTYPDGRPRTTKHTDLAQNGPARVSGELVPTNDPNVWVMNDDSGRYSNSGPDGGWQRTRSPDNLRNANRNINQADLGNQTVVNEADLYE